VVRPKPEPKAEPSAPAEEKKPEVKAEPAPAPTGGKGSVIQLGAFANRAQAERAWSALSARFPDVAAMNKMVIPFSGGIRLRAGAASSQAAKEVCQKLKVAGENCFVAN
jgi:cell division septation protein DedD